MNNLLSSFLSYFSSVYVLNFFRSEGRGVQTADIIIGLHKLHMDKHIYYMFYLIEIVYQLTLGLTAGLRPTWRGQCFYSGFRLVNECISYRAGKKLFELQKNQSQNVSIEIRIVEKRAKKFSKKKRNFQTIFWKPFRSDVLSFLNFFVAQTSFCLQELSKMIFKFDFRGDFGSQWIFVVPHWVWAQRAPLNI